MASKKAKPVNYRRKREGKTNYKKRLRLLLSEKPRLVLRLSNTKIVAQIIEFDVKGDKVLFASDSNSLKKLGWNFSFKSLPAAYLFGLDFGKKALSQFSDKEIILDTGLRTPQVKGKIYAFLKGVLDGGLNVLHGSEDVYPIEERLNGKSIENYAKLLKKSNEESYKKRFALNLKNKADPCNMNVKFEEIKINLLK
ncbi:50S ribosomal protein L18 [archaeon]|jgi:large subunit ribosomal protein L18|nr:50S ribosomal protein L18 [archaeon]MBT3450709.1 50S ribosomal protein L18 [archaeon]MBT6869201.1 50S ribosomal protein L18 [archaeon]MBT7193737.1 50S ribosomal protein L18 [archaeon]MBT7381384.1 50S ribosomal protein L18 [archaeon]